MGGGSNIEGESLSCQLHFRNTQSGKTKINAFAQGSFKFRDVSNSFWKLRYKERENQSEDS